MSGSGGEPTEEPTPERVRKARQRGQVAVSRELSAALGLLVLIAVTGGGAAAGIGRLLGLFRAAFREAVASPGAAASASSAASAGVPAALSAAGGRAFDVALALSLIPLVATLAVAVLVSALQTGGLFTWQGARVDLSRLSPIAGLGRLFGPHTVVELGKGLLKVGLVGVVAATTLEPAARVLPRLTGAGPAAILAAQGALVWRLGLRVALALVALGLLDWLLARRRHRKSLMMTREEVKREYKNAEGDPHHKAERQRLHRELSEQRMIEDVRKADFVVVNPEHIAVAVRYDRDADAAPVILAKGERLVAEQIKQVAREAGVPIYRDIGLARALHDVDEGEEIPEALYEAVAELLRVLWELDRPPAGATAAAHDAGPPSTRVPAASWRRV